MNWPNRLTILRVLLIPFFVICLMVKEGEGGLRYVALVIFIVASMTDALDGHLARKHNMVTNFGKFMDPLADKLLVCSAMICLIELGQIPAWIVLVIIAREFIISGFRLIASDNGVVIAASWWGKMKTIVQMIMIILLLLDLGTIFPGGAEPIYIVEQMFIYLAMILTVISLIDYIVKNVQVLSDRSK